MDNQYANGAAGCDSQDRVLANWADPLEKKSNVKFAPPMNDISKEISEKLRKSQELELVNQLNELISRGIIEVQMGPLSMTRDYDASPGSHIVKLSQGVKLVPRNLEYLEKLERQVKMGQAQIDEQNKLIMSLTGKLSAIRNAVQA